MRNFNESGHVTYDVYKGVGQVHCGNCSSQMFHWFTLTELKTAARIFIENSVKLRHFILSTIMHRFQSFFVLSTVCDSNII